MVTHFNTKELNNLNFVFQTAQIQIKHEWTDPLEPLTGGYHGVKTTKSDVIHVPDKTKQYFKDKKKSSITSLTGFLS